MTNENNAVREFLSGVPPFSQLDPAVLNQVAARVQLQQYSMGQEILVGSVLPDRITILYQGSVRLLGYDPSTQMPIALALLEPGEIVGWSSLARGMPCETAIASTEVQGFTLAAPDFLELLAQHPPIAQYFQQRPGLSEVFEFVVKWLDRQAQAVENLPELVHRVCAKAVVCNVSPGRIPRDRLNPRYLWFASSGNVTAVDLDEDAVESLSLPLDKGELEVLGDRPARLLGFPDPVLLNLPEPSPPEVTTLQPPITRLQSEPATAIKKRSRDRRQQTAGEEQVASDQKYPFARGRRGPMDATLACFAMLSQYLRLPFRRDVVQRVLSEQVQRRGSLSLPACGSVAEMMGLQIQLLNVPASAMSRITPPALIRWEDGIAVLYEASDRAIVLGNPREGIEEYTPQEFVKRWDKVGQVLLLQPGKDTPKQRFDWQWFLPALFKYRQVLLLVLFASFFVQLFGLANPLIIQLIIDKVIVQGSFDTLDTLGIFLLAVAVFEALLSSLRTYLFVDTTNRIDLTLGAEIIDHLLRLPLRYFERRPVGELSSRVNELENIRSFLTGTALTAVLDSVFSVVYIAVMLVYSWQLTIVALAIVPLFVLLTLFFSPIIRKQLRLKAERNAQTQSYLVEVMSGIQTVKAQNIESRSRWSWQDRYARYVSAGFKTVITSTTASAISNFLNKFSGLLVLWVGASLVLKGDLTLGQLIAFRIIASYVTGPMLRLGQLWQNFQETALSLERIGDIIDTPQEVEKDRRNIPMPTVEGRVKYENVSFRFKKSGPLQLDNVNLELGAGNFVGIVGQSGAGKSTLTKLLVRLYEQDAGRIFVDGYDVTKVELYSLRRQIGVVPQDTLLFDGTVEENIALTNPDATTEEIIEAAKVAAAHDFIMDLPNGYNTRVGERGSSLSGGQRQRIAIARTVLQRPRMMILDEATSALDYQTERQVCDNLAKAFENITVFFITHRLGTVRNADVILVMDKGKVAERGNHDELMAMQGRYYCLYQEQEVSVG